MKILVEVTTEDVENVVDLFTDTYGGRGSDEYPEAAVYAAAALLDSVGDTRWYADDKLRMKNYEDTSATASSLKESLLKAVGTGVVVELAVSPYQTPQIRKLRE